MIDLTSEGSCYTSDWEITLKEQWCSEQVSVRDLRTHGSVQLHLRCFLGLDQFYRLLGCPHCQNFVVASVQERRDRSVQWGGLGLRRATAKHSGEGGTFFQSFYYFPCVQSQAALVDANTLKCSALNAHCCADKRAKYVRFREHLLNQEELLAGLQL